MPNKTQKTQVKVAVKIAPGPATPAMWAKWRRVWARLIQGVTLER